MNKIKKLQKAVLLISESILLLNEVKEVNEVGLGTFFSIENDISHQEQLVVKYNTYIKDLEYNKSERPYD